MQRAKFGDGFEALLLLGGLALLTVASRIGGTMCEWSVTFLASGSTIEPYLTAYAVREYERARASAYRRHVPSAVRKRRPMRTVGRSSAR